MGKPFDLGAETADILNTLIANKEYFTAYNVTNKLRRSNPNEQISHGEVRAAVHTFMAPLLGGQGYDHTIFLFPKASAVVYYHPNNVPTDDDMRRLDNDYATTHPKPAQPTTPTAPAPTTKAPRHIKTLPVASSCLTHVGYDVDSQTLRVIFQTGRVYDYPNVAAEEFARLIMAPSVGRYYNKEIKLKQFNKVQ